MNLSDFGAGSPPEKQDDEQAHETRSERAKHRRRTYRLGRCRAVSTSKFCRCGGAVVAETDGDLCHYHGQMDESEHSTLVTIDGPVRLVAQWCGTGGTLWNDIPEPCREVIAEIGERTEGEDATE